MHLELCPPIEILIGLGQYFPSTANGLKILYFLLDFSIFLAILSVLLLNNNQCLHKCCTN